MLNSLENILNIHVLEIVCNGHNQLLIYETLVPLEQPYQTRNRPLAHTVATFTAKPLYMLPLLVGSKQKSRKFKVKNAIQFHITPASNSERSTNSGLLNPHPAFHNGKKVSH